MKAFFRKVFGNCEHDWQAIPQPPQRSRVIPYAAGDGTQEDFIQVKTYHMRCCIRCGKVEASHISERTYTLNNYPGDLAQVER